MWGGQASTVARVARDSGLFVVVGADLDDGQAVAILALGGEPVELARCVGLGELRGAERACGIGPNPVRRLTLRRGGRVGPQPAPPGRYRSRSFAYRRRR